MISRRISFVIFVAFLFTGFTEAKIEEDVKLKVFDSNKKLSEFEIQKLLSDADHLQTSDGYKRVIKTTKVVNGPGNKPHYEKTYWYYKEVNCSETQEIEKKLNTLMKGVLKEEVDALINDDGRLKNMKKCRVGLTVVIRKESSFDNKNASHQSQKRDSGTNVKVTVNADGTITVTVSASASSSRRRRRRRRRRRFWG